MQRLGLLALPLLVLLGGCHAIWPLSAGGVDAPRSKDGAALDLTVQLEGLTQDAPAPRLEGGVTEDAPGPQLEGGVPKDGQPQTEGGGAQDAPGPQTEGGVSCSPMDAKGTGSCKMVIGVAWTGKACVTLVGCSCSGVDCGSLFPTVAKCEEICL